ncbi:hypothetical protein [Singulisphaera acidiphila]|uniref:Uncharacterized protein n=1 Tax=Singulisphaera acidiphila (strain ATCC BAA-1392 / DSM 18658 / VKM B-2454 / MOB10) TaxID=886293 RepID=L0DJM4_SINAD|nr:hypothetical protein [Singulisphaera acidiphila]AGA29045.1 hypothetical protein Sinac_4887 [Singulisphaera acidiphila DSM 18658]
MRVLTSLLIACGAVAAPGVDDASHHGEIRAIEQRVLEHRTRIKSGIFTVQWTHKSLSQGVLESQVNRSVRIWVDGDSIRGDFARVYPQDSPRAGETFRETISVHSGVLRHYSDQQFPGGGRLATEILPLNGTHARTYTVPDPRLVGMSPSSFLNLIHASLHQWVGKASFAKDAVLSIEDFAGERAHRVSFTLPEGVTASLWFYDAKLSVACIDVSQFHIRERVESTYDTVDGYGWFPSKAVYRRWESKDLVTEDVTDIKVEQINQPIDPAVFDFPGMGLPEGTVISDRTREGSKDLVLTATGLKEWKDDLPERGLMPSDGRSRVTTLLVFNGVIFLVLALYFIFGRGRPSGGPT